MVVRAVLHHCTDQILWNTIKTEATNHQRVSRLDILDSLLSTRHDFRGEAESCWSLREDTTSLEGFAGAENVLALHPRVCDFFELVLRGKIKYYLSIA